MMKDHEMNDDPWGNGRNRSYFFTKKWEPPTPQLPWWCYIENEQTNWERNCLIERPTWREFFERERLQEKAWISSQVIERPPIIMIHRLTVKFVWNQLVCVSFLVGVDWFCAVLFEGSSPLKKYLNFGLSWQETIGPHFPMNCSKIGHPYLFGQNVFICLHSANKNSSADLFHRHLFKDSFPKLVRLALTRIQAQAQRSRQFSRHNILICISVSAIWF